MVAFMFSDVLCNRHIVYNKRQLIVREEYSFKAVTKVDHVAYNMWWLRPLAVNILQDIVYMRVVCQKQVIKRFITLF